MHWFDHFLTNLSKYLWIKTGDRHYHFVEPWFMDIPFCRMETVYHNHFVEQKARQLQNGPLRPHPENGNGIFFCMRISLLHVISTITITIADTVTCFIAFVLCVAWWAWCPWHGHSGRKAAKMAVWRWTSIDSRNGLKNCADDVEMMALIICYCMLWPIYNDLCFWFLQ